MNEYMDLRFLMEQVFNTKLQFEDKLRLFIINKMKNENYKKFSKIDNMYTFIDNDNNYHYDTEINMLLIEFEDRLIINELIIEENIDF